MLEETSTQKQTQHRRRAPGPPGNPLLGSMLDILKDEIDFFQRAWHVHGDVFRFRNGPVVAHVVVHPEYVHHVLVHHRRNYVKGLGYRKTQDLLGLGLLTSEATLWQGQRRLMQPPFTPRNVARFDTDMVSVALATVQRWRPAAASGEPIHLHREMLRLTINIIGKTLLGMPPGGESSEVALVEAYREACEVINTRLSSFTDLPLYVPTPGNLRIRRALKVLDGRIASIIAERRKRGPRADLLSTLIEACHESGEGMSDQQIRDEVITLFFAGHETTASALTWTWYLLSEHPEIEQRLHAELDKVLGGRLPTFAELPRLEYTRRVFEEAVRLYPPVWTFPRQAVEDDEIGGFHIPKGSLIFPCQYLTHRHPEFWEEPERFDPDRFLPERARGRPLHAYYPFGAGPRACLGNHFSLAEASLVLATLAQHFSLRRVPGLPVKPVSVITLQPEHDLRMTLVAR